jgi:endonuclease/exonuclease/phosphatase family metal-dependent hydrolase
MPPPNSASRMPELVERLTAVSLAERERFLHLPQTAAGHAEARAAVAAFTEIEVRQPVASPLRGAAVRVAAWNLERCLYPEAAARVLQRSGVDIALLTEMDVGMLRTGQLHTIGRLAGRLGHGYSYGLEFLELMAMEPPPRHKRHGQENLDGFHGNGITAAIPMGDPVRIPLDEAADWFAPVAGQRRVGARMALAATFQVGAVSFVACTVHLENRTDGVGRARQMRTLLDALDDYARSRPVLIGGDLNTDAGPGGYTDPGEPLFSAALDRGYDWAACNLACPTTRTSAWSAGNGDRQLDWFCARGIEVSRPEVVPAVDEHGLVLSDHELIALTLHVQTRS